MGSRVYILLLFETLLLMPVASPPYAASPASLFLPPSCRTVSNSAQVSVVPSLQHVRHE